MTSLGCNYIKVVKNYQEGKSRWSDIGFHGLFGEMYWNKSTYSQEFQEYLKNDIISTKLVKNKTDSMNKDLFKNGVDHNLQ